MALGPEQRRKRRVDCDLYEAAARFPAFFQEWARALKTLTLTKLEMPSQRPAFEIEEQTGPESAPYRETRARLFFSRHGSDDPGCALKIRVLGQSGLSYLYPTDYEAISPDTLLSIPAAFAAWLAPEAAEPAQVIPQRRPPGRKPDPAYDRAYQRIAAGESDRGAFELYCQEEKLKADDGELFDAFKAAMKRRRGKATQ